MRTTMPVRIALIVYVSNQTPAKLVKVIDSIRKQSQIPWFTRIVIDNLGGDLFDPGVQNAIWKLKMFCPNVVVMMGTQSSKIDNLVMANRSMSDKEYDVLAYMDADVVLPVDTLFHVTNPYLSLPMLLGVDAVVYDDEHKLTWWRKFYARAVGRDLISGKFSVENIGVISVGRKIAADANLGSVQVPLWSDIHRHETAEPKLSLYY